MLPWWPIKTLYIPRTLYYNNISVTENGSRTRQRTRLTKGPCDVAATIRTGRSGKLRYLLAYKSVVSTENPRTTTHGPSPYRYHYHNNIITRLLNTIIIKFSVPIEQHTRTYIINIIICRSQKYSYDISHMNINLCMCVCNSNDNDCVYQGKRRIYHPDELCIPIKYITHYTRNFLSRPIIIIIIGVSKPYFESYLHFICTCAHVSQSQIPNLFILYTYFKKLTRTDVHIIIYIYINIRIKCR